MCVCVVCVCGSDTSVSTETFYVLGGPGIKSLWGAICSALIQTGHGPTQLLYSGYRVLPEVKRLVCGFDCRTPFGAEVKERVK